MKISDVMTTQLCSVGSHQTVADAARAMASENVGSVPVVDGDKIVGVLTDRDIVVRGLADGHDGSTAVTAVMTSDVCALDADEPASAASDMMSARQIRRVYVTRDGALVGVVSLGDISREVPVSDVGEALREISKS